MESMKKAIAHLDIKDGEIGTAFLVSPLHIITAKHTVESYKDVTKYEVCFFLHDNQKKYSVKKVDYEENGKPSHLNIANDIAILELNETVDGIEPLTLDLSKIIPGDIWISFGFPAGETRFYGQKYEGKILDILSEETNEKFNLNLHCLSPSIIDFDYSIFGLSGAPIMCNGNVVAVVSNNNSGGVIGASTLVRSKILLEKHIPDFRVNVIESDIRIAIKEAVVKSKGFIKGFSDELHDYLKNELIEIEKYFLNNTDSIKIFLEDSEYPKLKSHSEQDGIEASIEVMLMLKSMYGNISILTDDDFANLSVYFEEKFSISFIYSNERNTFMPEILMKVYNDMSEKSGAQILRRLGVSIPPNPLIFDNFNDSKRYNLCKSCGQTFDFKEILQNYFETEDSGLLLGIEKNNYSSLSDVKVICGRCIRRVRDSAENSTELGEMVVEKIYG